MAVFIDTAKATAALARRLRRAYVVASLLAVAVSAQSDESRGGGVYVSQPRDRRQITGISGVRVVGNPTLVFDHLTDKREPNHIPDLAVTAWRDVEGTVNLLVPHFQNYRMRGPDLEHLTSVPEPIFSSRDSASDRLERHYNYHQWLAAPYTFDGRTIHALGHHEWYACLTAGDCRGSAPPTPYSTGNYQLNSWANAVTSLVSRDGGASWRLNGRHAAHLVTNERFTWSGTSHLGSGIYRQALNHTGMMSPSRIIREGDHYYSIAFLVHRDFTNIDPVTKQAPADKEGWVLMRASDPARSSGWEGWVSDDKYVPLNSHTFTAFQPMDLAGQPQIIYDINARTYVAIFASLAGVGPVYYATTPTLATPTWSAARPIDGTAALQIDPRTADPEAPCSTGFQTGNYVSLIDTHSAGLNFEFTDGDPWLFYTYNPGLRCGGNNLDRDIVRIRLNVGYR
jgi:hypothetical protein